MDKKDELKNGLEGLIKEAEGICILASKAKDMDIIKFGMEYQNWYTRAPKIVEVLAPDRLEEFISYYKIDPKRKSVNA